MEVPSKLKTELPYDPAVPPLAIYLKKTLNQKYTCTLMFTGLPRRLSWERIHLQCRRPGLDPWVRKFPWRKEWRPTPVFLPGESHRERSLVGYSPRGHKESDVTKQLSLHFTSLLMFMAGFPAGSVIKNPPADVRDADSFPGSGRSPGEGSGNPLQCSCLGSPLGRGA